MRFARFTKCLLPAFVAIAACANALPRPHAAAGTENAAFPSAGAAASADPTVRPARLFPESIEETAATAHYGIEPNGGIRSIASGLRIVTLPHGGIAAAEDHFAHPPESITALPERLSGGFLFVIRSSIWRAEKWLGHATPMATFSEPIHEIVPGLDRVYVRLTNHYVAIDGKTGRLLDLGPFPKSPYVASFAAADGWRAVAVADWFGTVATFDAGATWHALNLPINANRVMVTGSNLSIGGTEAGHDAWFSLDAQGVLTRLGEAPHEGAGIAAPAARARQTDADMAAPDTPNTMAESTRIFGKRPLATTIVDGWPLSDGTAVIARDGALGRVRLSDGALVDFVRAAFPLKLARCQAILLGGLARRDKRDKPGLGFVCGEPHGRTIIYAYDESHGSVFPLRQFDKPRIVTSSGNGALAVRGACAPDADPNPPSYELPKFDLPDASSNANSDDDADDANDTGDADDANNAGAASDAGDAGAQRPAARLAENQTAKAQAFCIYDGNNTWRDIVVHAEMNNVRVVVLANGKIVILTPPRAPLTSARLTVIEHERTRTVPIAFPKMPDDVAPVLHFGMWLDGFEERRPGIVGGWIEAGGVMLGVEIDLDGNATPGQYVRDAGMPFVSGRYGFGWAGGRGYETTDGGMKWTAIDLPNALSQKVATRACGPIGCIAAGWLRVGWGESKQASSEISASAPATNRPATTASPPKIDLVCEPTATAPPKVSAPKRPKPAAKRAATAPQAGTPSAVLAPEFPGLTVMPAFYNEPGPLLRDVERGMMFDVSESIERGLRTESLAHIYGWAPKTGEFGAFGRWQVKWLSPFSGWPEIHTTTAEPMPVPVAYFFSTNASFGSNMQMNGGWQIAPGDDATHAMLVGRSRSFGTPSPLLVELEADRRPLLVKRTNGEPLPAVEGLVRTAGRWFLATVDPTEPVTTTIIWQVEGGIASEIARIPRVLASDGRFSSSRLVRRSDERAIGLVRVGQANSDRSTPVYWVLPIDIESGQVGEPTNLGYADLGGHTLSACANDFTGWTIDTSLDTSLPDSSILIGLPSLPSARGQGSLRYVFARIHLTSASACLERVAGIFDGPAHLLSRTSRTPRTAAQTMATPNAGKVLAAASAGQFRYPLTCTMRVHM
ncbi:MAG: hypothetical protein FWD73_05690 [Polyangiaceae bacterium]|nr:hypothetical protein [Polyangiaceae bacterium]